MRGSLLTGSTAAPEDVARRPGSTIPELIDWLCVGGWPAHVDAPASGAQAAHRAYLAELARVDMRVVDGVRRDPQRVQRVLRSLARNISTEAEITTIAKGTSLPPDAAAVGRLTVGDYLDALARLMITEDLGAWTPSLRSRARLRTRPVRHLADPCLAIAALRATPKALLAEAIEVTLGENHIEEGAESLTQFARTVNLRSALGP